MKYNHSAVIHIVEDDEEFGSYLVELFEDEGYSHCHWFKDGIEGLNASLQELPDLVVLDLNLPLLRGEEVCRLLRSSLTNRHTKILICSDMPHAKQRELELLKIGADRYVEKPFQEELFLKDVEDLLVDGDQSEASEISVELKTTDEDTSTRESKLIDLLKSPAETKDEETTEDETFDGYRLLDVIGGGATGTVYKAVQTNLDREVAIKVFLKDQHQSSKDLKRFRQEARLMAKLNNPNIITVFDFGQTGYTYYIVMELMKKGSVLEMIRADKITIKFLPLFVEQVFNALTYLHNADVIHRDIKPGNIMVTEEGNLKLGDFGISCFDNSQTLERSERGYILGTKAYMGPEILAGELPSKLSDQYSLGRTILRLFEGQKMYHPRKTLRTLHPEIPRQISSVIEKMLSAEPTRRFTNLEEPRDKILESLGNMGTV